MRRSLLALVVFALLALGQSNVGSITGIVTDPTGAVVPDVEVVVTNQDTRITYHTRSNESGVYVAPSVAPGRYLLEMRAQGFKKKQVRDLMVETGQTLRLDGTLEVGELTEVVEVQATAAPLMQESAEISETISASEIRNLPMTTRDPYGLMVLSVGMTAKYSSDPTTPSYSTNVSINGSRSQHNVFFIDGALTDHIAGTGERIGSIEAIQEFKVLGSTYSAEYGRTSGGVITFQVKSGTTHYHGSLYNYHRNNKLDANNWVNNARGISPKALIRNQFGGTVGGPAPGMSNKMFFFASYEGVRDRTPTNRARTIPDPAIRGGNFSGLPVVINDPLSASPFPDNTIPASRLDGAGAKFLNLFPNPNSEGIYDARYGIRGSNWLRPGSASDSKNFGVGRLDYSPTGKDKIFLTYAQIVEGPQDQVIDFDNVLNTTAGIRFRNVRRSSFSYTRFLSPNLTTELMAFVSRDPREITPWFPDFDVTKGLGIARKVGSSLPRISISGFGNFGENTYQKWVHQPSGLSDKFTWLKGRHTFKFGAQMYQNQFWYVSAPNESGDYSFNGEITGKGAAGRNNPVNALADLLLGAVKQATIPIRQIPVNRLNYNLGLFVNDDWKVTSRLTLNLGLRYEFETRQIVKNNVYSRVDLTTGNLLVAGRNASRNLNLNNDYLNFSPRLGVAYAMNDKTVLRAGFGVAYSSFWLDNAQMVAYPGWTATQAFVDLGLGRGQPFTLSQGFPAEQVPAVTDPLALFAAATPQQPLPIGGTVYSPSGAPTYDANDRLPYSLQWSLSVQRQIGFGTVLDVAYVASRGVHLPTLIPANSPGLERAPEVVIQRVPLQQVRPFPNVSSFSAARYNASSIYNSLQVKATRRFRAGFGLDANYTFSKKIDNAEQGDSGQIPWQYFSIERAVSSLDQPHVFSLGFVYELPFGKGKALVANHRLASALLGGFQINGVLHAGSGFPLTITQNVTNLVLWTQRPDVVNPGNLSGKLDQTVYEGPALRSLISPTSADFPFRPSSNVGFGNLGRNTSRAPGFHYLSLSLFRDISITERLKLQLRLEGFNALNSVNFLSPGANINSVGGFGLSTSTGAARQVQISARLSF